jgi:hypothetical protein
MAAIAEVYASTNEKFHAFIRTMISQRTEPKMTEIELRTAVDAFTGMIFASVLRRSIYSSGYSREIYLATCIDLFLAGVCPALRLAKTPP